MGLGALWLAEASILRNLDWDEEKRFEIIFLGTNLPSIADVV